MLARLLEEKAAAVAVEPCPYCGETGCARDCRQCAECGNAVPADSPDYLCSLACAEHRAAPSESVCPVCGDGSRHVCRPEAP